MGIYSFLLSLGALAGSVLAGIAGRWLGIDGLTYATLGLALVALALLPQLGSARPLASEVDRSAGYHAADSSRLAAQVSKLDLARWLPPAEARRLSVPSRYAVAAARMALEEAGLPSLAGRRVAVVLATAFGARLMGPAGCCGP